MAILRRTLEWLLSNIPFTIRVKKLLTKIKTLLETLNKILKNKNNSKIKTKILLFANINQTLQI